jgi:hypothetical protein
VQPVPRLTATEEAAFHAHGHVVLPGVFGDDEIAAARAAFDRLYAHAQVLRTTQEHDGAFFVLKAPPTGDVVVQRVVWAGGAEPGLLALGGDDRLVQPALQLLSITTCEQLLCQAHFKMPADGVSFDWHQDIQHRDKGNDTWRRIARARGRSHNRSRHRRRGPGPALVRGVEAKAQASPVTMELFEDA